MEALKSWKVDMIAGGKTLAKVKIQRGNFHGDVLSTLIAMIPLNHILRKCMGDNKFTNSKK